VFKKTVLSYMHGPKKGKLKKAGENRILRGLYDLYSLPTLFRRWAGYVACGVREREIYTYF
jgi:hypothetical protein